MGFLNHSEGGMVFYQVFLLSPSQKYQGKAVEVIARELKLFKTFVWISSKNSASG
jgi:hypothetical protein